MSRSLLLMVVGLIIAVGISFAGQSNHINTVAIGPTVGGEVGVNKDTVKLDTGVVWDSTEFTISIPDGDRPYFTIFPPLNWAHVKLDSTIEIKMDFTGTTVAHQVVKHLWDFDTRWRILETNVSTPLSFSYNIRDLARTLHSTGQIDATAQFSAFMVGK